MGMDPEVRVPASTLRRRAKEKKLYGRIKALARPVCWASNAYWCEYLGVGSRQLQRMLKSLAEQNLISILIKRRLAVGGWVASRQIRVKDPNKGSARFGVPAYQWVEGPSRKQKPSWKDDPYIIGPYKPVKKMKKREEETAEERFKREYDEFDMEAWLKEREEGDSYLEMLRKQQEEDDAARMKYIKDNGLYDRLQDERWTKQIVLALQDKPKPFSWED